MNIVGLTAEQKEGENAKIKTLEAGLRELPQVDLGTENVLSGKVLARTIFIPAGTVLTGAKHNLDAVNTVYGDITVTTDTGPKRITGYLVFGSKAGSKRAGFAHADTYWTTAWHTELTDLAAIEDEMTDESAQLQSRALALTTNNQPAIGETLCP